METIFTNIYEQKIWGDNSNNIYSGSSGFGSKIEYNKDYILALKKFIHEKNIESVVDLGCGDFITGPCIYDTLNISYTGYDIYQKVIDFHKINNKNTNYEFINLDFYNKKELIKTADLCIIKDVLQHWPLKYIYNFLDYLIDTKKFKYILICNCSFQTEDNTNIELGQFRPLSLKYLPLSKYNPYKYINYFTKEVSIIDVTANTSNDNIVIAILAKNKEYCLPFYLNCIYNLTYSKHHIHLYIRTNDNTDNTVTILKQFIDKHGNKYGSIYFDDTSISQELTTFQNHEWNSKRFKILAHIRQDSIKYAEKLNAHYFVADCDNFVVPSTLHSLLENSSIGIIAPMLSSPTSYSNYHYDVDEKGYYKYHEMYPKVLTRIVKGIIEVPVVHCTYFIHNKFLKDISYDDNSYRYEYVIFSDVLRKHNIKQYLDNRIFYGFLEMADGEKYKHNINTIWKPYLKHFILDTDII
uniref:Uncharacterized protein n=1 Tax=viral metagenome TaxID=1070528 RepID=A0A6C0APC6_9ZZZZ